MTGSQYIYIERWFKFKLSESIKVIFEKTKDPNEDSSHQYRLQRLLQPKGGQLPEAQRGRPVYQTHGNGFIQYKQ